MFSNLTFRKVERHQHLQRDTSIAFDTGWSETFTWILFFWGNFLSKNNSSIRTLRPASIGVLQNVSSWSLEDPTSSGVCFWETHVQICPTKPRVQHPNQTPPPASNVRPPINVAVLVRSSYSAWAPADILEKKVSIDSWMRPILF